MVVQFSAAPGISQVFEEKGCSADNNLCNLEFSATLGNQQKFKYKNRCCNTEQCNNNNITREYSSCLCPNT